MIEYLLVLGIGGFLLLLDRSIEAWGSRHLPDDSDDRTGYCYNCDERVPLEVFEDHATACWETDDSSDTGN